MKESRGRDLTKGERRAGHHSEQSHLFILGNDVIIVASGPREYLVIVLRLESVDAVLEAGG